MKLRFEGRWRIEDLKQALCDSLDMLSDDQLEPWTGVVWVSGAGLYFTPENKDKGLIAKAVAAQAPDAFLFANPNKSANRKRSDKHTPQQNIFHLASYRKKEIRD